MLNPILSDISDETITKIDDNIIKWTKTALLGGVTKLVSYLDSRRLVKTLKVKVELFIKNHSKQ